MRLLLAEDEKSLSRAVTVLLRKSNYEVDSVYDGEEALAYLSSGNYDGAILDIMMPGMNGYDLLREIRKHWNLPVLILSAKDLDTDKILGLNLGDHPRRHRRPVPAGAHRAGWLPLPSACLRTG